MERNVVWTERASGDIEAIVRYIARRDPSAAGRIGLGIYDRVQIFSITPRRVRFSTNFVQAGGASSFFGDGGSFTQFERGQLSSDESGQQLWERLIWRRRYERRANG
jgi:plasmid stabilization system protein ParE